MVVVERIVAFVVVMAVAGQVGAEPVDCNDISQYYGFGEMEIIKLDWGIKDLRICDFNGDGRSDIAVVNIIKSKIELLLQKASVGPGEESVSVAPEDFDVNQITPPTRFDRQNVPVSQKVRSFVCGDLNSDGMTDLAFYGEPKGLYVILQRTVEGETDKPRRLSWRTRKKIRIEDGLSTPSALVCADLNNDGADDLALAGQDGVYIIVQKGDGSLAEAVKYPGTCQARGIEVGDLDGDGINDLVLVANDSEKPLHVRFGLKTGRLGPEVQFFIETPYALKLDDIDTKAGDEILTVDGVSGRLICYKLTGEAEEGDWPTLFYPLASTEEDTKRDLAVGDFDGDCSADVVVSEPGGAEVILYKQIEGLGLAEPVRFPGFSDIASMSVADIDGDEKAELGVLSVREKVIGISEFEDERLSFPQPVELNGEPVAMELADVDGDEDIDCVYVSRDANDVRFLRVIFDLAAVRRFESELSKNNEVRIGVPDDIGETGPALELKSLASNPDGLKVVDVDQDGLGDILIFVKYEFPILIRQTQKRQFEVIDSPKAQASLIKEASLSSTAIADVDGKAGEELLVAQKNFARSLIFAGGRSWTVVDQYNAKSTDNKVSGVGAFDIEQEGGQARPSILLLDGQKGRLQILKAGDDRTYRFERELDVGKWDAALHSKMLFEPLTGGKARSIVLFDSEKFALITPPSAGGRRRHLEQQFGYETKIKDGIYGNLASGDINSDGRADIVMVEYKGNHMEILALGPENRPMPAMRFKIFEQKAYRGKKQRVKANVEPRELDVADVTGDGKSDLVTIIHDRIIIYPQD